jgi:hypothetical protein
VPEVEACPEGGTEASGSSAADDVLALAARAILGHLRELAECDALCERMGPCAGVLPEPGCLRLVAALEYAPQGDGAALLAALAQRAGGRVLNTPADLRGADTPPPAPTRPPLERAIAYIPNETGRSLLHNERITR